MSQAISSIILSLLYYFKSDTIENTYIVKHLYMKVDIHELYL